MSGVVGALIWVSVILLAWPLDLPRAIAVVGIGLALAFTVATARA